MRVKNWVEYQHYHHRNPPWIKLHKKTLDDYTFQCLPDASRALAPCLWLLASESKDGTFDGSTEVLVFRLHQSAKWIEAALIPLISSGLIIVDDDASVPLANCLQEASTMLFQSRVEKSKEEKSKAALPDWIPLEAWNGFIEMRKKSNSPFTERAKALIIGQLLKLKEQGQDVTAILDQSTANGWKGVFPVTQSKGNGGAAPWWISNEGIQAKAKELGVEARKGESYNDLKARVSEALNRVH